MATARAPSPKTIEFKVDLVFKVVVIGLLYVASQLSWRAFEEMAAGQRATLDLIHAIDTRTTVNEFQIKAHESRIRDAEAELNGVKRSK